ncbi:MAG: ABC transporter ATP-binding protein [Desulfobacteraceae bacterium]|nr:ABC transporter ATP-binding protein [Desulfobacteraceae bacterium]
MTSDRAIPVLDIKDLNFGYGQTPILKDISFSVNPGEFTAVIGPNGCGKTTLIKTILKSEPPDTGTIHIQGENIEFLSNKDLAKSMAAVLQSIDPASMSVRDYVLLGRLPFFKRYQFFETQYDLDIAQKYMDLTGITALSDSRITQISGGERQLCAIARALTQEPDLLVLDEPTSHLDITHQKRILDLITSLKKELSLTVLMVLHDLNLAAEYADRLILLNKNDHKIYAAGSPEEVLTESAIQTVYQTHVKVRPNPVSQKPYVFLVNSQNQTEEPFTKE